MTALNMAAKEKKVECYNSSQRKEKGKKKDAKRHPLAPIQAANQAFLSQIILQSSLQVGDCGNW
jgi:hypothetical protein